MITVMLMVSTMGPKNPHQRVQGEAGDADADADTVMKPPNLTLSTTTTTTTSFVILFLL